MSQVTRILEALGKDGPHAASDLLPLVYDELRRLAHARMQAERPDHTLDATALVHEAYARLVGNAEIEWANRAHFFHAAANAMRRILIEHARAKAGPQRGGNRRRIPLDLADLAVNGNPEDILALEEAISRLKEQDPEAAQTVHLRFYAGMAIEDVAKATGRSERTIKRDWAFARAFLIRTLGENSP